MFLTNYLTDSCIWQTLCQIHEFDELFVRFVYLTNYLSDLSIWRIIWLIDASNELLVNLVHLKNYFDRFVHLKHYIWGIIITTINKCYFSPFFQVIKILVTPQLPQKKVLTKSDINNIRILPKITKETYFQTFQQLPTIHFLIQKKIQMPIIVNYHTMRHAICQKKYGKRSWIRLGRTRMIFS